jgi:16S rRNA processing protein RimM
MGRIGAPWGIKGWVKLFSFADPPENLLDYHSFYIQGPAGLQVLEFDEMKEHGQGFVGHIKGCDVRELTGEFSGKELLIAKLELPDLDEGEGYYWHQLEGLRVQTKRGEDLGTLQHLLETGANDVMVIKGDDTSVDKLERLLPFVMEQVVKSVDLQKRMIVVDWDPEWDRAESQ